MRRLPLLVFVALGLFLWRSIGRQERYELRLPGG
jgi:hypothetical protein